MSRTSPPASSARAASSPSSGATRVSGRARHRTSACRAASGVRLPDTTSTGPAARGAGGGGDGACRRAACAAASPPEPTSSGRPGCASSAVGEGVEVLAVPGVDDDPLDASVLRIAEQPGDVDRLPVPALPAVDRGAPERGEGRGDHHPRRAPPRRAQRPLDRGELGGCVAAQRRVELLVEPGLLVAVAREPLRHPPRPVCRRAGVEVTAGGVEGEHRRVRRRCGRPRQHRRRQAGGGEAHRRVRRPREVVGLDHPLDGHARRLLGQQTERRRGRVEHDERDHEDHHSGEDPVSHRRLEIVADLHDDEPAREEAVEEDREEQGAEPEAPDLDRVGQ